MKATLANINAYIESSCRTSAVERGFFSKELIIKRICRDYGINAIELDGNTYLEGEDCMISVFRNRKGNIAYAAEATCPEN